MFDIGFSELLVIGVVALLVIGPERLPRVARTAGHLLGRLQRYVNDVKADIRREVELDELKELRSQFEDAARSVEQSVHQADQEIRAAGAELDRSVTGGLGGVGSSATAAPATAAAATAPSAGATSMPGPPGGGGAPAAPASAPSGSANEAKV